MITLKPDQQEVIDRTVETMRAGCKSTLLQGATGSGKSVMSTEIVRRAADKCSRTFFVVPRRELIKQIHSTFDAFDIGHSYIASGLPHNPYSQSYVCSTDTLKNRLDKVKAPNLAIIDETHYGGAGLDKIISWLKGNGSYIIGLSATPQKSNGKGLKCWYDDMVLGPSIRWLIDNKRLSGYRPFAPDTIDLSRVKKIGGDYSRKDLDEKMRADRAIIGNAAKHYIKHAYGKLFIVYCTSINHSKLVADQFNDAGVPVAHIDGTTPEAERNRMIRDLADRKILGLCNCELLTFGFDLASQIGRDVCIEAMIDLRPTVSLPLQMQKWGRALRYKDEPALIFDHVNNFFEHGYPCDNREWTLEDITKSKRGDKEDARNVRQCEMCFFCHPPAPICPNCHYVYPIQSRDIQEIEGELKEIEIQEQKKARRMEVGRAKSIADLKAIQQERGYKPGWVWVTAKAKNITC